MRRTWTTKEIQYLRENCKTMTDDELAENLNRSPSSVKNRRFKLGLPVKRKQRIYEVVRGHEVLAVGTKEECAAELGLKPQTIIFYASKIACGEKERLRKNNDCFPIGGANMKVLQIEQQYKESHVIDQLNKLGFYAIEGMSYRELKRQLVLERAKQVKVGSTHSQWF